MMKVVAALGVTLSAGFILLSLAMSWSAMNSDVIGNYDTATAARFWLLMALLAIGGLAALAKNLSWLIDLRSH